MAVCAAWIAFLIVCMIADAARLDARRAVTSGQLSRAVDSFEMAQALRPRDVDVALLAAQSLGAAVQNGLAGAADPADEWAQRAVARLPDSSRSQYVAGLVAAIRGETDPAIVHLSRAAELSPADPRIHHELRVTLLIAGDVAAARAPLERAVALAPDSAASWKTLHDACTALEDAACARRANAGETAAAQQ